MFRIFDWQRRQSARNSMNCPCGRKAHWGPWGFHIHVLSLLWRPCKDECIHWVPSTGRWYPVDTGTCCGPARQWSGILNAHHQVEQESLTVSLPPSIGHGHHTDVEDVHCRLSSADCEVVCHQTISSEAACVSCTHHTGHGVTPPSTPTWHRNFQPIPGSKRDEWCEKNIQTKGIVPKTKLNRKVVSCGWSPENYRPNRSRILCPDLPRHDPKTAWSFRPGYRHQKNTPILAQHQSAQHRLRMASNEPNINPYSPNIVGPTWLLHHHGPKTASSFGPGYGHQKNTPILAQHQLNIIS